MQNIWLIFLHICASSKKVCHTFKVWHTCDSKMFNRLQNKWKVNGLQLGLILCTFAIGGSLTGFAGRKLMNLFNIEKGWLWILIYIILICLIWPLAVLLISFFFGQYRFFSKYIRRIGARMGIIKSRESGVGSQESGEPTTHIAIFASGAGSNAQRIIDSFRNSATIKVALVVSNNPAAGVLNIASKENIPGLIIEKERFFRGDAYIKELKENQIDFIVLAGFLWKVPTELLKNYPGKIVNIHPALLPKFGGKGLYGHYVHDAVIANKEKESGISIHFVDEIYDHGKIIFQQSCPVLENDTAESLAKRIQVLEHEYYPKVIEEILRSEV
ncbi:MAG: phosphoribosylglycinamide formyltransferase [Bacteroidota bacterium]